MESYNTEELLEVLSTITDIDEKADEYFINFTEEQIAIKKQIHLNTAFIASNKIKENPLKSSITEIFNKFQPDTITMTEDKIRNLEFKTLDDFNLLVLRFMFGLNNDNLNVRNLTALLLERLKNFTVIIQNVGHVMSVFIINKSKNEFDKAISFENVNYTLSFGKKTLLLITTLYNNQLIVEQALSDIITAHQSYINENIINIEKIKNVENAIYQFHWLLTNIKDKTKIENEKEYLLQLLTQYKNILSSQVRFTCDVF
jgi:hypothetical protein